VNNEISHDNYCYGVTKDPNENDYLLVLDFRLATLEYKIHELINKLQNTLNKLINENDSSVKTNELLNELLETIKIIENCKDTELILIK